MEAAPVFIKVDKYKDVTTIMNKIKEKISSVETALSRIREIKAREDEELTSWKTSLQNTETKINEVDQRLLKPELQ